MSWSGRPDASVNEDSQDRRDEFEELAFEHLSALHAFAQRLTGNPARAEDLVQETYLRAYRFFDRFERGTNAKAWLFRILKNAFINEYRRAKAQPSHVDFDKLEGIHEAVVDDFQAARLENPEEALDRTLLSDEVSEALDDLPEEYRLVVLLCLVQGFTYQETADALEVPIGTVMSRLHRGRKLLQARLLEQARSRGFTTVNGEAADARGETTRS